MLDTGDTIVKKHGIFFQDVYKPLGGDKQYLEIRVRSKQKAYVSLFRQAGKGFPKKAAFEMKSGS